jgi:hypothetical protein
MKSLLSLAVIGAAALLPLTASAQHGRGGHASSGSSRGSSGFSGGHVGSVGSRSFSPSRGFAPRTGGSFSAGRPSGRFAPTHRAFVSGRPVGRIGGFNNGFRRFDRFPRPFIFSGGCIYGSFFSGFPCRRFFFGGSFVLGYAPLYADYSYYPDYAYPPPPPPVAADSYNNNDGDLNYEVNRLSGEVDQLRDEQQNRQQYDQRPAEPRASSAEPAAVATLVFRDGRKLTVPNYVITGQTIWVLNERTSRRIPIADLDIAATQRANEANGIDFRLH